MIPVMQTKFGTPYGNCLAACIASIFSVPLDSVPQWTEEDEKNSDDNSDWWHRLTLFCYQNGYWLNWYPEDLFAAYPIIPKGIHIANGPAERGLRHSCVALDGEVIHDPHPDNAGLEKITDYYILTPLMKEQSST